MTAGITTKTGDYGMTSLYLGGRVKKDDLRIETCGTLDELSSFLGAARSVVKEKGIRELIRAIQEDLIILNAEIVTKTRFSRVLKKRICGKNIKLLEDKIEELETKNLLSDRKFYLAGENVISSIFDIARTLARRAERKAVSLKNRGKLKNHFILIYLNRLSDLLYLLARVHEKVAEKLKIKDYRG